MFESHSQTIHTILRNAGEIDPDQLTAAVAEHQACGKPLANVLIDLGLMERGKLLAHIARELQSELVDPLPTSVPASIASLLTPTQARTYGVLPLRVEGRRVDLVAVDPFNQQVVDDLSFVLGGETRVLVGDPEQIEALIGQCYGQDDSRLEDVLEEIASVAFHNDEDTLSLNDIESMAGQAPIIRFVNLVLAQAIKDHASDIHFEPFEHEFKIRYRIDGALYEMVPPDRTLALPIISRLKVLANLNIAERRVPQDGRIKITLAGHAVDLRISTLPTQFGESVVLRVLDQANVQLDISQLGLPENVRSGLEEIIRRPNGIFIVTGPTGSGKTTTLYSGLRAINSSELKLLTAEDPVEYEIDGIMQIPVNPGIGLTFATVLRSFLRQDPDVIMVGEIRDLESAQVAIQASLTGHLVFSTLHTSDAAGTVTRLIDMGVEPFLIASTLEAVLAQRLVRRICPQCKVAYDPPAALLEQCGLMPDALGNHTFHRGTGCVQCNRTGYQGRIGLFEWMRMSEPIRELVLQRASTLVIRQEAVRQGLRTLRDDGLRAIFAAETTVDEVVRYT
jgi:type IV pilus assembly protein PilB